MRDSASTVIMHSYRPLPEEWTDEQCRKLYKHACDLGENGNLPACFLALEFSKCVGWDKDGSGAFQQRPYDRWLYDEMRSWIASNIERVRDVWELRIVYLPKGTANV